MSPRARLGYVDWMRGLAVLLMMQTHAYDSWLTSEAKATAFYRWSRLVGGYPAPLFLFLAGLSAGLLTEGRLAKGGRAAATASLGVRRGLEVLGYAVLFRLWMFTTGGFSKPGDLLRVDVLNCMGLAMMVVAAGALRWTRPGVRIAAAAGVAAVVALLTPLAWDASWPAWVPPPLLAYLSGRAPGAFFPLFPWAGFVAVGAGAGLLLGRAHGAGRSGPTVAALAGAGAAAIPLALGLDRLPPVYPRYDFWSTSPNYFLIKSGILLLVLGGAWLWGRMPWASWPSPLRQVGRTSLLVYFVHIEIAYGGLVARGARGRLDVPGASLGLALLTLAMLLLSLARTEGPRWRRQDTPA